MYDKNNKSASSMAECLRTRGTWLHVSQWFRPTPVTDKAGVVTIKMEPQVHGKVRTYNVGNNAFKRLRRSYGLSLRQAARLQVPA